MDMSANNIVDDLVTAARHEDLTLKSFIDELKVRYIKTLIEFDSIARLYFNFAPKKYRDVYNNIIQTLNNAFDLNFIHESKHSFVDVGRGRDYNYWGPAFWSFIHYTSILMNVAFEHGVIKDQSLFAAFVYNVDFILPCNVCAHHYEERKNSEQTLDILKRIAFNMGVDACFRLHHMVSQHAESMKEPQKNKKYGVVDFANQYNCIEINDLTTISVKDHSPTYIDVHKPAYTALSYLVHLAYGGLSFQLACLSVKKKILNLPICRNNNEQIYYSADTPYKKNLIETDADMLIDNIKKLANNFLTGKLNDLLDEKVKERLNSILVSKDWKVLKKDL